MKYFFDDRWLEILEKSLEKAVGKFGRSGRRFIFRRKKKKNLPDPMKCAAKAMKAAADLIDLTINLSLISLLLPQYSPQ